MRKIGVIHYGEDTELDTLSICHHYNFNQTLYTHGQELEGNFLNMLDFSEIKS